MSFFKKHQRKTKDNQILLLVHYPSKESYKLENRLKILKMSCKFFFNEPISGTGLQGESTYISIAIFSFCTHSMTLKFIMPTGSQFLYNLGSAKSDG